MLQRIQSLYILTASITSLIGAYLFGSGLLLSPTDEAVYKVFEEESFYAYIIVGLFLVSTLISIVTIFLFNNRGLQLNLGKLNILTNLLLLGISVFLLLTLPGENLFSEKGIGVIVSSFIVLMLVLLANKAIKKDENLVKSVDRLR